MSIVAISDLKPGMVIVQITEQNGPVRIRKSGLVTSTEMVLGLQEMGVLQLEIDPSQTVEIDSPQTVTSSVQGMLLQSSASQGHDNAISDQFNRSLFLPSVSGIPSMWQYYGKRFVWVAVMMAAGLTVGWSGAAFEAWLKQAKSETVAVESKINKPSPSAVESNAAQPVDEQKTEGEQETQSEHTQLSAENAEIKNDDSQATVDSGSQVQNNPVDIADQGASLPTKSKDEASEVSPELLKKFNQAVAEIGGDLNEPQAEPVAPPISEDAAGVPRIDQVPQWVRDALPKMSFSAHMYASDQQERWVTLNGVKLQEGDWINPNLQLVRITPQKVILNYKGQQFSLNALADW
ncbi:general secretion pathway protein GspB [Neptunicella marina]|uniref:General secretion pathway protein GspB n=1 Tax=Neptunicella marina TaxID=2125989 RepID=A0A8J6M3N0_9ALTE|nr:general secretion pathway protein GspB [Neptunicella marina]MBC3767663.1 general secretion pathway protein GspB [Neptunicella marina]